MSAYSSSSNEDDMILNSFVSDASTSESFNDEENFSSSEDKGLRRNLSRSQNFVEIIVPSYNQNQFKKHFRISRTTFNHVINLISLRNVLPSSAAGRKNVSCEKG
ncbi:unnamed protein product [Psylliodes chrysocephalus]|uniref:Uncharacterized protein n=1 Tax=Psylliodes chrysocephalus TaxID=3402493 RepID=A0A9P0CND4_9CUCU|nr:unnamed protein product [Psylliodes chrysocephala]